MTEWIFQKIKKQYTYIHSINRTIHIPTSFISIKSGAGFATYLHIQLVKTANL